MALNIPGSWGERQRALSGEYGRPREPSGDGGKLCFQLARQLARVVDDDRYRKLDKAALIDLSTGAAESIRDHHKAPETLPQARRWEWRNARYLEAGLCDRCAAQAAWGHQVGFTAICAPCVSCAPLVAAFALPAANGWRKHPSATARYGSRKTEALPA